MTDPLTGVMRRLKAIEDYLWKKKTYPVYRPSSLLMFTATGILSAGSGTIRFYNHSGATLSISKVYIDVNTAPTGTHGIIVDVNLNGTTIFTTQANRPVIAAGAYDGSSGTPDVTAWPDGDYLTADIDAVGTTIAGADLTVTVIVT